tara:strand:+ start:802 stop:1218 length:417 start_codon:yes stop_codon:yes gene_type:complete
MGNFKLSKNSKNNIKGINGDLIKLINRVLKKSEHDFGIPGYGGLRTQQEQRALYRKKVSKLDGFRRKSYHQSGNAVDIFIYDEHGACWDCKDKYKDVADLIKAEFDLMKDEGLFKNHTEIRWGGDWKTFVDLPHFEIR